MHLTVLKHYGVLSETCDFSVAVKVLKNVKYKIRFWTILVYQTELYKRLEGNRRSIFYYWMTVFKLSCELSANRDKLKFPEMWVINKDSIFHDEIVLKYEKYMLKTTRIWKHKSKEENRQKHRNLKTVAANTLSNINILTI